VIDDIDRAIIEQLQTDGRMSYSQLGHLVGLSDAAARQRVNRLVANGVIDIVAVTDPKRVGLAFSAMLGLTVTGDARKVAAEVGALDHAVYVIMTTGRYDVLAEVIAASSELFVDVVDAVRAIDGVGRVEVMTYLDVTKQTYDWGVADGGAA
jgi:Lrp/AsnC family transcriptional regulator, regulator for asnA, asnC and gidA